MLSGRTARLRRHPTRREERHFIDDGAIISDREEKMIGRCLSRREAQRLLKLLEGLSGLFVTALR
jgi:hypothetical protein